MTGILIVILVGIAADTVTKIVKARAGGSKHLQAELDQLREHLDDQAIALARAESRLAEQDGQLQELHERLDFAERLLTQARDAARLGPGPAAGA
jgi:uncharacterized protein (DUF3084 family)